MSSRRRSVCALGAVACLLVPALSGCAGGEDAGAGAAAEAPTGVAARLAGQYDGGGSETELKEFVDRETNGEERQELREELAGGEHSEQSPQQAEQGAEAEQEQGEAEEPETESAQEGEAEG
ncbi:MAG: hypothetical protein JWN10_850 [Solirubrobacterales bacterium]|nr:hypothetical protein [Solirubrobacterales bacterium]